MNCNVTEQTLFEQCGCKFPSYRGGVYSTSYGNKQPSFGTYLLMTFNTDTVMNWGHHCQRGDAYHVQMKPAYRSSSFELLVDVHAYLTKFNISGYYGKVDMQLGIGITPCRGVIECVLRQTNCSLSENISLFDLMSDKCSISESSERRFCDVTINRKGLHVNSMKCREVSMLFLKQGRKRVFKKLSKPLKRRNAIRRKCSKSKVIPGSKMRNRRR
ncbi:hypothetical protein M514_03554 [Trichuris suis]|uniref:Uncharacterized protein n=1 Tax=Trichuris suis TaxID=68888 RepID=A0A085NPA8_9BILA|nr:hypothetical protein M514_03554 [Trichuris suis]